MARWARVAGGSIAVLVFATVAVAAAEPPGRSGPDGDQVVSAVDGVVTAVDARSGVVRLEAEGRPLALVVPPAWAARLKPGDRVHLAIAIQQAPTLVTPAPDPADREKMLAWLILVLSKGRAFR